MNVYIPIPISKVHTGRVKPSKTYRLDRDRRRIIGMVDGLEAVNQAIYKAIDTPRFRCLIYSNQYGSEIKETIITQDATPEYIRAEIPRQVKDALKPDSRVLDVFDFHIELDGDEAHISFKASTIFGETEIEVVI